MGYSHHWRQLRDLTDNEFGFIKSQFLKLLKAPRPIGVRVEGAMYFHEDCAGLPCEIAPEAGCGWVDFFTHPSQVEGQEGCDIAFNGAWPEFGAPSEDDLKGREKGGMGELIIQALGVKPENVQIPATLDPCYETFVMSQYVDKQRIERDGYDLNFCKTGGRPYDLFVVAMLAIMKLAAPDAFVIGTDGDSDDWRPAMEFLARVTGKHTIFEINESSGQVSLRGPTPEELNALALHMQTAEGRDLLPSQWISAVQ